MTDIQVQVHRPVAFPSKFLGAPLWPAGMLGMAMIVVMMVIIITSQPLWILVPILAYGPLHVMLIYLGHREPHLSTLMATYHHTQTSARNIGRAARGRRVFRAA